MFVWEVFWAWLGRRGPERRGESSVGGISRIVILVVEGRTTRSFFFENSEQENYGSFFLHFPFFNMRVV